MKKLIFAALIATAVAGYSYTNNFINALESCNEWYFINPTGKTFMCSIRGIPKDGSGGEISFITYLTDLPKYYRYEREGSTIYVGRYDFSEFEIEFEMKVVGNTIVIKPDTSFTFITEGEFGKLFVGTYYNCKSKEGQAAITKIKKEAQEEKARQRKAMLEEAKKKREQKEKESKE